MPPTIRSLRFPVGVDGERRELAVERDYGAHVDQMVRQVLLTAPGERIHLPEFGCGLRRMVFAPNDGSAAALLRVTVQQALDRWLGSVLQVRQIDVDSAGPELRVRVQFHLRATGESRYVDVEAR